MTTHLTPNSMEHMSKDQIKLRKAISQTWQLCKQNRGYLGSLSAQVALVYGAFLLLGQAIFGDLSIGAFIGVLGRQNPAELIQYNSPFIIAAAVIRSVLDWIFPALLESAIIVYMYRRFVENDQVINEITDLRLTARELKVFGVFLVSPILISLLTQSFFGVLTSLSSDTTTPHDTVYIVKMAICATGFLASFYSMLRLMVAPFLAVNDPRKSFKNSWNLTKKRTWFFALLVSTLYIPTILLQMIIVLVSEKVVFLQNTPSLSFGFLLIIQILGLILKAIPVYLGFVTVYKNIKETQHPLHPVDPQNSPETTY